MYGHDVIGCPAANEFPDFLCRVKLYTEMTGQGLGITYHFLAAYGSYEDLIVSNDHGNASLHSSLGPCHLPPRQGPGEERLQLGFSICNDGSEILVPFECVYH